MYAGIGFVELFNPYLWAVSLRNLLYDKGFIETCRFSPAVISVGNLSVGGTGKSSLVRYLAKELSKDFKVCILSRGYKRKSKGTLLVSKEEDWTLVGDEPCMLARLLKDVSLVVDEKRCRGASFCVRELKPDVLILDDGFQHRRIERDFNLLLVRKRDFEDRLLPFGRLREPLWEIKRADAVVVSYFELEGWKPKGLEKPVFVMERKNWKLINSLTGKELTTFDGLEFIAFAGLGDNSQFFRVLESLGVRLFKTLSFPDHYHYKNFELDPKALYITTLKDLVKLKPSENLYYLDFDVEVEGLIEVVKGVIINKLQRVGSSAGRATDS
ncbi:MAG: tetraacyldisaccharide 4'-kinase [Aquificota bacterium]|nr:MAG: tetraacyldisaccharide 4'-kinase [Aquificota bacterium]